jgi:hypothetical protein
MMDADMRQHARAAIARIDHVLERGADVRHAEIQVAVNAVVDFRNRAIERRREGAASAHCLDQANALTSLAYGAEFPLSGLHRRRFEQTRAGMEKLLEADQ